MKIQTPSLIHPVQRSDAPLPAILKTGQVYRMFLEELDGDMATLLFRGETLKGRLLPGTELPGQPGTTVTVQVEAAPSGESTMLLRVLSPESTSLPLVHTREDLSGLLMEMRLPASPGNLLLAESLATHRIPVTRENILSLSGVLPSPQGPSDPALQAALFLMGRNRPLVPFLIRLMTGYVTGDRRAGDHLNGLLENRPQLFSAMPDSPLAPGEKPVLTSLIRDFLTTLPLRPDRTVDTDQLPRQESLLIRQYRLEGSPEARIPRMLQDLLVLQRGMPDREATAAALAGVLEQLPELPSSHRSPPESLNALFRDYILSLPETQELPLKELPARIRDLLMNLRESRETRQPLYEGVLRLLGEKDVPWGREIRLLMQHMFSQEILARPENSQYPYQYWQIPLQGEDGFDTLEIFLMEENRHRAGQPRKQMRMVFCLEGGELGPVKVDLLFAGSRLDVTMGLPTGEKTRFLSSRTGVLRDYLEPLGYEIGSIRVITDPRTPFSYVESTLEPPVRVDLKG